MHKIGAVGLSVCYMIVLLSIANNTINTNMQNALTPIQSYDKSQVNELKLSDNKILVMELPTKIPHIEDDKNINSNEQKYSDEDLYLLAQVIYAEAGSDWISDEIQFMVGSVVLNRVNSPYFPDNIYDVIHQKGQYQFILQDIDVVPNQRAIDNAKQLLDNQNDLICPSNILFQSESAMGDGIYKKYETKYATLYFCYKD